MTRRDKADTQVQTSPGIAWELHPPAQHPTRPPQYATCPPLRQDHHPPTTATTRRRTRPMAGGRADHHDPALRPGIQPDPDRRCAGLRPAHRALLDQPLAHRGRVGIGLSFPTRTTPAGQPPIGPAHPRPADPTESLDHRPRVAGTGTPGDQPAHDLPPHPRAGILATTPPGRPLRPRP